MDALEGKTRRGRMYVSGWCDIEWSGTDDDGCKELHEDIRDDGQESESAGSDGKRDECADELHGGEGERDVGEGEDGRHNRALGARGEEAAVQYLLRCGYEILERNWRCRAGEADVIAMDDDTLVFVEVKTRSSESAGLPEDAVTPEKRRRYERIAIEYLRQSDMGTLPVRFDVIAITVINPERAFLRHHCNAFGRGE